MKETAIINMAYFIDFEAFALAIQTMDAAGKEERILLAA